jgi:acyl-CoA synthetase (NDP forming)
LRPSRERLRRLLRPRSVAFVGGSVAPLALAECEAAGFDGAVYAVHPTRDEVAGRRPYRSVDELPAAPDAAFVAVNAAASVDVVRRLAALGAGGAVLYAAGFAEAGTPEGAALEDELRGAAGDMPVLGPNCYGVVDVVGRASAWPVPFPAPPLERGVAMVLQSGNLGINVTMADRSLPLGFLASVGNQTVVDVADVMDAYLGMDDVTGIGLYLEGVADVPRFAAAAARALEAGVPVAACKAGASELGRELAYTHTASLAGEDDLYDGLFERYGIARARSIPQLLELLKGLTAVGPLRGGRVFVFTCSGAECALSADAASAAGLALPQPGPDLQKRLAGVLPEHALVSNPLDYGNALWGAEEPLRQVFRTALDGEVDAALLVIDYPRPGVAYAADVDAAIRAFADATGAAGMPAAVASVLPESFPAEARAATLARGVCPLQGLDDAFAALGACAALGRRRAAGAPPTYPAVALLAATEPLGERAAKELAASAGVEIPAGRLVQPADAERAASALGFPVAVKLSSAALPHKAAAGAMALDLVRPEEVDAAVAAMLERHRDLAVDGVLVERMVEGARCELLVALSHDPSFGHVVLVGSGGALVELVDDVVQLLRPVGEDDVRAALARLRVWPRLRDADVDAAVEAVLAVAGLADRGPPAIAELELNPVLVLDRGAVAVDALCRLAAA